MLFLNSKEENIIKRFAENEKGYVHNVLILKWENVGQVLAKYEIMIEDESDLELDDENYEEFWSFGFNALSITGNPPIVINRQNNFLVSYHNFPDEIILDGIKIS